MNNYPEKVQYILRTHSFDILASMITESCRLSSEIENFPWTIGGKSARGLALELYSLTATIGGNLTLSINDTFCGFDDVSGNIRGSLGTLKTYLQAVSDAVRGKTRRGASMPFPSDPEVTSRYNLQEYQRFSWNLSLAQIGIPLAPTERSPVILSLREAIAFNTEAIMSWLRNGAIITAEAYHYLRETKGLLQDCPIHVTKEEPIPQSYLVVERVHVEDAPEWLKDRDVVTWIYLPVNTQYRIHAGEDAKMWSALYDNLGARRMAGVVVADAPYRIAVVAHEGTQLKETGRQWLYQHIMAHVSGGEYAAMVEKGVNQYPIWWDGGSEAILGLTNFSLESYPELDLRIPTKRQLKRVEILGRNGKWAEAQFTAADHPNGGIRLTLQGESVPDHASFETYKLTFS